MKPGPQAFAVWVTGLPASGKSTLVSALRAQLNELGIEAAVLESDALRPVFTPQASYQEDERDLFYRQIAYVGSLLTRHGVPVIFDATANRRIYRDRARQEIPRFLEVYVECPLSICIARDPKGIYRKAREGAAAAVPGLQASYEPPEAPDVVVHGAGEIPANAARRIMAKLREKKFIAI
ncbi:MAG: adenylyl-sulfate kinase [Acidobacteria bacterium]|nr:adenylyl-sulfate kinase [Acidobacteriota bacterium]